MVLVVLLLVYVILLLYLGLIHKKKEPFVIAELHQVPENVLLLLGLLNAQLQVIHAHHIILAIFQKLHQSLDVVYLLILLD